MIPWYYSFSKLIIATDPTMLRLPSPILPTSPYGADENKSKRLTRQQIDTDV